MDLTPGCPAPPFTLSVVLDARGAVSAVFATITQARGAVGAVV